MSHAGGDAGASPAAGRGRGVGRGRPGRARGRGRGSFRFPGSKSSESDSVATLESSQAPPDGDGKRKAVKRQGARSRGSTNATAPESVVEPLVPRREKELPPHIAGAAVDAESLVSRVRELAINGHAHTSSIESRFTMSLNWADEEDDPDSLPDLDDWAKPKAPSPDPVTIQETLPETIAPENLTPARLEDIPPPTTSPKATEAALALSTVIKDDELSVVTKKPRRGLESSIWASPSPEATLDPPISQKEKRPRQAPGRGSTSITRLSDLPFHPSNIARTSDSNGHVSNKSDERGGRLEPKTSPRKPHARPVISTDAISRLSRSLGRDTLRQPQPTT